MGYTASLFAGKSEYTHRWPWAVGMRNARVRLQAIADCFDNKQRQRGYKRYQVMPWAERAWPGEKMTVKKKIIVVDDHRILRECLAESIATADEFEVVGEADDGRTAISLVGKLRPDMVLLDISMPGFSGLETLRELNRRYPETKVLILTIHKTEEYFLEALEAGASGYVLKDSSRDELVQAMRYVLSGRKFLSPEIQEKVVAAYLGGDDKAGKPRDSWDSLTHRERQILKLVAEGRTNSETAGYLNISIKTVAKHRANLMKKLDLHNASSLTAFAVTKGLLER